MFTYDPEGLLRVHATEHVALEHAGYQRLSGTHPIHLSAVGSVRRAKRRMYIHYTLRHQALRHGIAARRYA